MVLADQPGDAYQEAGESASGVEYSGHQRCVTELEIVEEARLADSTSQFLAKFCERIVGFGGDYVDHYFDSTDIVEEAGPRSEICPFKRRVRDPKLGVELGEVSPWHR